METLIDKTQPGERLPDDLLAAAARLGEALGRSAEVQAYLQADAAVRDNDELTGLEAEIERVYGELVRRQPAGEMLFPYEVHEFYKLRDRWTYHPLVAHRSECLQAVKALFGQAGSIISSILSVDYTELAL